jgi:ion channel-forming bestrophin family protein
LVLDSRILRHFIISPRIFWPTMLVVVCYSLGVVYFNEGYPKFHLSETKEALSLASIAIGLVFAFRTNSAYDRWWEGRKLWGQLVNETRNLAIKISLYLDLSVEERDVFVRLLAAFPLSLKEHLREGRYNPELLGLPPLDPGCRHVPLYISESIQARILNSKRLEIASGMEMLLFDTHTRALLDICGACERIRNTPLPGWFAMAIWVWIWSYLLALPWFLAPNIDMLTVPVLVFVCYFGISIEMLAEEMQEPFGCTQNDLPLDQICLNIIASVEEIMHVSIGTTGGVTNT